MELITDTVTMPVVSARRKQLQDEGYCILKGVANDELLSRTQACVNNAITAHAPSQPKKNQSPGLMLAAEHYPGLSGIIGNPVVSQALEQMGLNGSAFWKAVIISKPPAGPRLYWHQDCLMWDDPRSYSQISPMIFLMYYMEDTTGENGCLRVLPGTHRKRHILHQMGEAHTSEINDMENPDDPRFLNYAGEKDVPMRAGDVVIGDARMFHATHENRSDERRTVITIWYHPLFDGLQPSTQSWIHKQFHERHGHWPESALAEISAVIPRYDGDVPPMKYNRFPDKRLT